MAWIKRERSGELAQSFLKVLAENPNGPPARQVLQEVRRPGEQLPLEIGEDPNRPGTRWFERIIRFGTKPFPVAKQPRFGAVLAVALIVATLMLGGCGGTVAPKASGSGSTAAVGASSGATTTSKSTPATQRFGLCSYPGAIPYSQVTADGAPYVTAQLGIALARSDSSPMIAAAYHQFNTMRCTHYQHKNVQDPTAATYYYDCVGFTSYTLRIADRPAWDRLLATVHLSAGKVPSPRLYASFFTGLTSTRQSGWSAVTTAATILPGDLLAWSPSAEDAESAGHSVIALSAPTSLGGGRYALVVMDSTATPHGSDDTRRTADPLSARNAPLGVLAASSHTAHPNAPSGLGIGTIALDTSPSGAVTGVEWTIGTAVEHVGFASARPLPGS